MYCILHAENQYIIIFQSNGLLLYFFYNDSRSAFAADNFARNVVLNAFINCNKHVIRDVHEIHTLQILMTSIFFLLLLFLRKDLNHLPFEQTAKSKSYTGVRFVHQD